MRVGKFRLFGDNFLQWSDGIGKIVFGDWAPGLLLLALAAVAGYLIFWDLSRRGWQALSGAEPAAGTLKRGSAQAQKNLS